MSEQMLTTTQVAERLGVTPNRVWALIKAGRLPSQQLGRDHLIKESDLALVADRKPGRPKTKVEEAESIEATRESVPVKTAVAKKRASKKKAGN